MCYTGKEVCQGCKISGSDAPRNNKNDLCHKCSEILKIGKSSDKESSIKYTLVKDWNNGFNHINWDDKCLDTLANNLLRALDNNYANTKHEISTKRAQYLGHKYYKIPEGVAEALNEFLNSLDKEIAAIRKKYKDADEHASTAVDIAVSKERDKIYQEGIDKGKSLLIQLNSGQVTMSEFENKLHTYKNK